MANVLTVPQSGSIYFDSSSPGGSTVPTLTAGGVSIGFDGCAGVNVTSYASASADRFSVDGVGGRLFSVNDSLTGTIFSVNDASGLPIIEVNSDATTDTIAIGEYGTNALFVSAGYVGVGTNTPAYKLDVNGDTNITTSLTVGTDLDVGGTTDATGFLSGGVDLDLKFIKVGSAEPVTTYLFDDGVHTLTSSAGVATPDANNGVSQKFPLTEDVTLNTPTNLDDGQSMLIQVKQSSPTTYSFTLNSSWKIIGSGIPGNITDLAAGKYAWLSITRYGSDYLISINVEA